MIEGPTAYRSCWSALELSGAGMRHSRQAVVARS